MTLKVGTRQKKVREFQNKLDHFQSLRSRKLIKSSHYKRKQSKLWFRFNNLVDDLHYQTISFLTSTFKNIFLPSFESQEIVRKNHSRSSRRNLLNLKHYRFKQRLLDKCSLKRYSSTWICTEEYTSKTCGRCGELASIQANEVFDCNSCSLRIDRDINGARNILLKQIKESS